MGNGSKFLEWIQKCHKSMSIKSMNILTILVRILSHCRYRAIECVGNNACMYCKLIYMDKFKIRDQCATQASRRLSSAHLLVSSSSKMAVSQGPSDGWDLDSSKSLTWLWTWKVPGLVRKFGVLPWKIPSSRSSAAQASTGMSREWRHCSISVCHNAGAIAPSGLSLIAHAVHIPSTHGLQSGRQYI